MGNLLINVMLMLHLILNKQLSYWVYIRDRRTLHLGIYNQFIALNMVCIEVEKKNYSYLVPDKK